MIRPQNMPAWMADIARRVARLEAKTRANTTPPVGSVILWTPAGVPDSNWLLTTGGSFSSSTYPVLADLLGGTTLPNLTNPSGAHYIIRAR